jgi:hypothetical protein
VPELAFLAIVPVAVIFTTVLEKMSTKSFATAEQYKKLSFGKSVVPAALAFIN